ncbi:phosphotransferase [Cellulomonas aerilata]|uniref:Aminoglycoside phosphotransferase domain-containing protein n=1 Tax=Cellulomonas aerilata TaxID=515326 RepID=A0A512D922_9CELL|nr:phosphotransferase [Cellulomonas aerilata]GEO32983.1 hypothetical protein CAE01nite_07080 [Cellulomonas aerilata]
MTALDQTRTEQRDARRAERLAAATALLQAPPPLDRLAVRQVTVLGGEVVHASRSRPVVRWHLSVDRGPDGAEPLTVIGKAFLRGGGEDAGRLLADLRAAGFDGPTSGVPRPLGWDPDRQLLAQEEAPAETLHALLVDGALGTAEPARRVGTWLARLHAVRTLHLPSLPADFETHALERYGVALEAELPELAGRIGALRSATGRALSAVRLPHVPTHGDFQPKNVHLDDRRVVVIDFDRAAAAPGARDLGHFVGQTRTMVAAHHGSPALADTWVGAFLDGYLDEGGSPDAVSAAGPYVARTYAEVLYYRLVVRPVGRTDFVPGWLDAWERCLDGGGAAL